MRRRDFLAALAGSAAALLRPSLAGAQGRSLRVALLGVPTRSEYAGQVVALREGLRELGYVEGRNLLIEERWAENDLARLPALAGELLRAHPDVIVCSGPGVGVMKRATSVIPVVMAAAGDAVEAGLVDSLARPGGNVTGSSYFFRELNAKRFQLVRELLPRASRIGMLAVSGAAANLGMMQAALASARLMEFELQTVEVRSAADYAAAIGTLAKGRADALVVPDHTMFVADAARITALATRQRIPVVGFAQIAASGGLLGYGVDFPALWRRAAHFVDRIAKGARPADLPVEQPTRFEFVVNVKSAKALGISVPQPLRLRADRVIE